MKIYKSELLIISYFCTILVFLGFAENTAFWKAYFYVLFQGLLEFWFISLLNDCRLNKNLIWSAIIFNTEYLAYNILIAYKNSIVWVDKLNGKVATLIFIGSIAVLLITAFFKNKHGRIS